MPNNTTRHHPFPICDVVAIALSSQFKRTNIRNLAKILLKCYPTPAFCCLFNIIEGKKVSVDKEACELLKLAFNLL